MPAQNGGLLLRGRPIVRFSELRAHGIPWSRSYLWKLMQRHEFPQSIPLGANTIVWYLDELLQWQQQRIAARDGLTQRPFETTAQASTKPDLTKGIETLELPARARNALARAGIKHIGDLLERSAVSLLRERGVGETGLAAIEVALQRNGFHLGMAEVRGRMSGAAADKRAPTEGAITP